MVYIMHSTRTRPQIQQEAHMLTSVWKITIFLLSTIKSFFSLSEISSTKILHSTYFSLQKVQQTNIKQWPSFQFLHCVVVNVLTFCRNILPSSLGWIKWMMKWHRGRKWVGHIGHFVGFWPFTATDGRKRGQKYDNNADGHCGPISKEKKFLHMTAHGQVML